MFEDVCKNKQNVVHSSGFSIKAQKSFFFKRIFGLNGSIQRLFEQFALVSYSLLLKYQSAQYL